MDVGPDPQRAVRKLSQIGYYRLSGFWYPGTPEKARLTAAQLVSATQAR